MPKFLLIGIIAFLPALAQAQSIPDLLMRPLSAQSNAAALIDVAPVIVPSKSTPRFDWKFDSLMLVGIASSLVDSARTENCLRNIPRCQEADPVYGPHPSAARLFGLSLAIQGAYTLGSYELRRRGPRPLRRLWMVPMNYCTALHVVAMVESWEGSGVVRPGAPFGGFTPLHSRH